MVFVHGWYLGILILLGLMSMTIVMDVKKCNLVSLIKNVL